MSVDQGQQSVITRKEFFTTTSILWVYILLLVGKIVAADSSWPNILLFIGAFGGCLGQLIQASRSRK